MKNTDLQAIHDRIWEEIFQRQKKNVAMKNDAAKIANEENSITPKFKKSTMQDDQSYKTSEMA